jgi:hypothetical protein
MQKEKKTFDFFCFYLGDAIVGDVDDGIAFDVVISSGN